MAEKVESAEQVPLKSDTDASETAPVEGGDVEAGKAEEVPEKKKKTFAFWKKNKNVEATDETPIVESKEEGEPKPKKCWWTRKTSEKVEKEGEPSFGFDTLHRDEKNLQTAIDLGFSDIFGEPDAVRSFNGVWKSSNTLYNFVRNVVYKVLSLIIALPFAILYGIAMGVLSAAGVFIVVPIATLLTIPIGWLFKAWQFTIGNVFDPIFKSAGQLLSGIAVRKYGINTEITQPITA
uniref:Caveolin n=1 Tax=Panagrellus redivivus TaxID=6233 RepID=A0A7E4W1Z5_PANRE